jgi:hypothetical protein
MDWEKSKKPGNASVTASEDISPQFISQLLSVGVFRAIIFPGNRKTWHMPYDRGH